jgi:hypothetical protein
MEREICPQEDRLMDAMRRGRLSTEMERHAEVCPGCRDALAIAQFLAEPGEPEAEVPAWGMVYWRAEIRARREQTERALRPMQQMQIAAMIAILLIAVVAGAVSAMAWVPLAAAGFGILLVGAVLVVRRMLLRDS